MFSYPNPVNEKVARVIAAGVAAISIVALATGWHWLLVLLALGFWARVAAGPRLSPLAILATKVAPQLGRPRPVPGPPKRFAQAIGAVLTSLGAIFAVAFDFSGGATAILIVMAVFATLEAAFGLCVGCRVFNLLMRLGVIPDDVCEDCLDVSRRYA